MNRPMIVALGVIILTLTGCDDQECLNNMRLIDGAKEILADKQHVASDVGIEISQLQPYILAYDELQCPKGGTYRPGTLKGDISCSHHGLLSTIEEREKVKRPLLSRREIQLIAFLIFLCIPTFHLSRRRK